MKYNVIFGDAAISSVEKLLPNLGAVLKYVADCQRQGFRNIRVVRRTDFRYVTI